MSAVVDSGVLLCSRPDEFIREAAGWRPGMEFPVLAGPEIERYRALFAHEHLPSVLTERRAGSVISTGGRFSHSAAHLLATATKREHHHIAADRLLAELGDRKDQLVAVVGLADELSEIGDWPGRTGALVGVLTGRSEASLSCLIYRTVTASAVGDDRVFICSNPTLEGAVEADAVSLSEIGYLRKHRPNLLVIRAPGRECCTALLDTMFCGRTEPLPTPVRAQPSLRTTPCLEGMGCFRTDLPAEDLVSAKEVNGTVIFQQSCSSIAIGTNAYPLAISLTLGFLEGTAVAVIGVLGVHVAQRSAEWDLADGLRKQLPLGTIVRRMEQRSRPLRGDLNRFGLLGDPGLRLAKADGGSPLSPAPRLRQTDTVHKAAVAHLARVENAIVRRLERLRWIEIDVLETDLQAIRREIQAIADRPFDPGVRDSMAVVDVELSALQARILDKLVQDTFSPGWDPAWVAGTFEQISREDADCTQCGRAIAVRLVMKHRVERELYFQTLQCRMCGDIWWTTEASRRTIEINGRLDFHASRDGLIYVEREIINLGSEPIQGAAGYSFRRRQNLDLPGGRSHPVKLAAGERLSFRAELDLRGCNPPADTHSMPVMAILNGVFVSSMGMLHLT